MTTRLLLFACLLATVFPTAAQTTLAPRSSRHNHELAADFAPFLHGQSGASLLYKLHLKKSSDVTSQKRFVLRFQLGYYETNSVGSAITNQVADTLFLLKYSGRSKHQLLRIGTEAQFNKKNFRYYFGIDAGFRHWTQLTDYQNITSFKGQNIITGQTQGETVANVMESSVIVGANYFFLPRWSIGMEANVSAGLEFSKYQSTPTSGPSAANSNTLFEVNMRLIRLLYLSYHFGK